MNWATATTASTALGLTREAERLAGTDGAVVDVASIEVSIFYVIR